MLTDREEDEEQKYSQRRRNEKKRKKIGKLLKKKNDDDFQLRKNNKQAFIHKFLFSFFLFFIFAVWEWHEYCLWAYCHNIDFLSRQFKHLFLFFLFICTMFSWNFLWNQQFSSLCAHKRRFADKKSGLNWIWWKEII